jgi:hypothetical protein
VLLAGRALLEMQFLPRALDRLVEAAAVYRRTERRDAVANIIRAALPIAQALNDEDRTNQLHQWLSELDELPQSDPVLGRYSPIAKISETHNIRKVIYRCTDWTEADLPAQERDHRSQSVHYRVTPLNFDFVEGQAPPDDAIIDLTVDMPYNREGWEEIARERKAELPCEYVVAQWVKAKGRLLYLMDEVVLRHSVWNWIREANNDDEVGERLSLRGYEVWQWAVREQHFLWLRKMSDRLDQILGTLREALKAVITAEFGLALTDAVESQGIDEATQKTLSRKAKLLLETALNRSRNRSERFNLTVQAVFKVRSSLARLYERDGQFDEAIELLHENVIAGFKLRHNSVKASHRRAIQSLVGEDSARLNRIRLRRLGDAEATIDERISMFDATELTRCRVLFDSELQREVSPSYSPDVVDL